MMMTTNLLLILMLATQAGSGQPTDPPGIRTLSRDGMSRIEEPREAVARTPAEWAALWREHAGATPAPAVDLAASTVVGVFLGTRPSAGFQAEITAVHRDGDGWLVEWAERRPGRGDMTAQVLTSPSHIVAVPAMSGPVRFKKAEQ